MAKANQQSIVSCKDDFPIRVHSVPFAQYSHFPTNNDQNNQQSPNQRKNIIIGGFGSKDNGFYELIVDDNNTNSISYKSFENDYKKQNANLKRIGLENAKYTHSYLIENNKYLVVFKWGKHYNVYDIENDKWLLEPGKKKLTHNSGRSVLINDEIIIVSQQEQLYFDFIGKNHMTNPLLIQQHKLKTRDVSFYGHGMCIIDFIQEKSSQQQSQNGSHKTFKLKVLLFGGHSNRYSLSSFLYLNISLSYVSNERMFRFVSLSIDENLIDDNNIKLINTIKKPYLAREYQGFGFQSIVNSKNEKIIIMIGGNGPTMLKNSHSFNCSTNELIRHENVNLIFRYIILVCKLFCMVVAGCNFVCIMNTGLFLLVFLLLCVCLIF